VGQPRWDSWQTSRPLQRGRIQLKKAKPKQISLQTESMAVIRFKKDGGENMQVSSFLGPSVQQGSEGRRQVP